MADPDAARDEQDQSEVFDEDNTNPEDRPSGEEAEQFEDLVDVFDATAKAGDADQDDPEIGEELDDDEIVSLARDEDVDDADLEDDDLVRGEEVSFAPEDDLLHLSEDEDDLDVRDAIDALRPDEVELEYVGDLDDRADAASAAQSLESDTLSDQDLRELDYKDEFTIDDADAAAPPRSAG
ncbi:MAG TPA: hypothetical protein VL358_14420 [Caulobacteraceae bacterium]|nr:hypothetical protein [Caulobacteraceae bacterium]